MGGSGSISTPTAFHCVIHIRTLRISKTTRLQALAGLDVKIYSSCSLACV